MTITERILARHAGRDRVAPGDNIWVDVDVLMTHDVCGPPAIDIFRREFGADAAPWDKEKLVIIPDHYIFTRNHHANRNVDILRAFAAEHDLPYYYDPGTPDYKGVCHVALAEEGFNRPGSLLIGTDSHTCTSGAFGMFSTGVGNTDAALIMGTGKIWLKVPETMKFAFEGQLPPYLMAKDLILQVIGDIGTDGGTYRALEFDGEAVYDLPVHERMTLTNMAIEAGGKNGIIAPDEQTFDYVRARTDAPFEAVYGDQDARYHTFRAYCVEDMEPLVAKPHRPDNRATVTGGGRGHGSTGPTSEAARVASWRISWRRPAFSRGRRSSSTRMSCPPPTHIGRQLHTTRVGGETLHDIFERSGVQAGSGLLRGVLGWSPGYVWSDPWLGGGDIHHQQEFSGAHGEQAGLGVSGFAPYGGGFGALGRHHGSTRGAGMMVPIITGRAYVTGDAIDTDQIIPAEHLVYSLSNPEEKRYYGRYALSGLPEGQQGLPWGGRPFTQADAFESEYAIVVAGPNFGCGSSREHAPFALREAGCMAVVAESYARIFYRNAIDAGFLVPFESLERLVERIRTGDELEIDTSLGKLTNHTTSEAFLLKPLGDVADILKAGNVFEFARQAGLLPR